MPVRAEIVQLPEPEQLRAVAAALEHLRQKKVDTTIQPTGFAGGLDFSNMYSIDQSPTMFPLH